jgi:hypothetical protein
MNYLKLTIMVCAALAVTGCKKKAGGDVIAKMETLQKSMCDCKDKACADKVNEEMTKWGTEMSKNAKPGDKPDPDMAKKSADVMTKYTECMTKAMMAGAGGDKPAGSNTPGDKPKDGSGAATTGSMTQPAGGKSELTSATWKKKDKEGKAGPLAFDRQLWVDDGHGNSQVYLIANCPKAATDCELAKHAILQPDLVNAKCEKGWSMIHFAFSPPKGEQKANMGPLKVTPGKYGYKKGNPTVFLEYTNNDRSIGAQSYQEDEFLEVTQVGETIAGTFNTKYQDMAYQGSFSAKKCTCDKGTGVCN